MQTIHDIKVRSAQPEIDQGVTDNALFAFPELMLIPSRTIQGTELTSLVRKSRSHSTIWRKVCEGMAPDPTKYEQKVVRPRNLGRIIEVCDDLDRLNKDDFGIGGIMGDETQVVLSDALEQVVLQMYAGEQFAEDGGPGLPELAGFTIDALSKEFNGVKDFVDADFTGTLADTTFVDAYMVRVADSASDNRGIRWVWGGGRQIELDEPRRVSVLDAEKSASEGKNAYIPATHRYLDGSVGLGSKSGWDVIRIANIPVGDVPDGFYLDFVLTKVYSLFPRVNKPTHILVDEAFTADWVNSRRLDSQNITPLKTAEGPLGQSILVLDSLGPSVPIVRTECIPSYVGAASDTDNPDPFYRSYKADRYPTL